MHSSVVRTALSSGRLLGGGSASVHAGITPPSVGLETPRSRHPPVNRITDRQVYKHNLRKLRLRPVTRDLPTAMCTVGICKYKSHPKPSNEEKFTELSALTQNNIRKTFGRTSWSFIMQKLKSIKP